ncbi:MAG: hypothetical protein ACUVSK_01700 [Desulfotomaculales bacterium]
MYLSFKAGYMLAASVFQSDAQVLLASFREAGKRLGEAAQAGYLRLSGDAFLCLRDFLCLLA